MIGSLTLKQVSTEIMPATFIEPQAPIEPQALVEPQAPAADVHGRFTRVSTDTRSLQAGDLFVALRGDNFDGHRFVGDALKRGACAVVVDTRQTQLAAPQLVVADTIQALGQIAALNRAAFRGRLVAITGSSGKTSVKGMAASILGQRGSTLATRGNLNNHIGVPLTLLELNDEHEFAVIEMGANSAGEIEYLTGLAGPDVALVNNVMPAHLEGFGSIDGVARAKSEIFSGLGAGGIAVVNLDDNYSGQYLQQLRGKNIVTFSLDQDAADFRAAQHGSDAAGNVWFELQGPAGTARIQLRVMGQHNVANALAAAACSFAVGAELADIRAGLESFQNIAGRMQVTAGIAGSLIIDDSYNANPSSVRAAIDTLVARSGETVLVLGDMAELGDEAREQHHQIGAYARSRGAARLVTVGQLSQAASAAFGAGAEHFATHEAAVAHLRPLLHGDMVLLVKGSFSSRMGTVVRALATGGEK
ncbi:UDP-N-acetylmuramoyl-tripeptide--D-alanyl-D-alanine ligase [Exilibacterium tricleocarpae]|uniref:UDP-N-acetylmuramoyl-tripeptide--D-alanyl-D-alanine ligase n=1 Tax=Exilibacterium tricleocarpae TaxID=2591008 RepID=A0A545TQM3_9GAMM|nr:UDP-N-acetylmuramoyl-tripeptide--D-alanyl-D-alanine ligase [Exilibacterium tricleocarpae]TQV79421.1 UDP-N-acetylmuramoyl-tripeptide--D-alanyl-D-alanine ligase [Exilibacterium tricleocarpae]